VSLVTTKIKANGPLLFIDFFGKQRALLIFELAGGFDALHRVKNKSAL
jgi:hypothetical protein